ncbi:hypothetical protein Tco_1321245, partial [Tanacetum coccineum]
SKPEDSEVTIVPVFTNLKIVWMVNPAMYRKLMEPNSFMHQSQGVMYFGVKNIWLRNIELLAMTYTCCNKLLMAFSYGLLEFVYANNL